MAAPDGRSASSSILLVSLMAIFYFLYVGSEAGYAGWIYSYALAQLPGELGLHAESTAAYLTSAFWGALALGRLVGVPISLRFTSRQILTVDLVGCIASLMLILAWPGSLPLLWIGTLAFGLFNASIFATMLNLAERSLALTGRITSWFFVGSALGGMTLPWLLGQLLEPFGPRAVMAAMLVDIILTAAVFAVIALLSRRRN